MRDELVRSSKRADGEWSKEVKPGAGEDGLMYVQLLQCVQQEFYSALTLLLRCIRQTGSERQQRYIFARKKPLEITEALDVFYN